MTKLNGWKTECILVMLCATIVHAAPTINLSKKIGPPTTEIAIWGHGFHPHSLVDIYFDTKDEAVVLTNSEGEFQHAVIHAPREAHPGEHWVTALERNNDRGDQRPFVVLTDWPELGFDARRSGLNRYENVLSSANVGNLSLRWTYSTNQFAWGDAAAPVVNNGALYIGSVGEQAPYYFYTLDAFTGDLLRKQINDFPFYFSPASIGGTVYAYAGDVLYAFNALTGAVLWEYNTCCFGSSASPVLLDGLIYVNMGDGNVDAIYVLNAATGALVWKWDDIGWPPNLSSPAVADGMVFAGSLDDSVYALNASNGALLWKYATTNWVTAAPVVANGIVYVASTDSNVYALDERTGGLLWKYSFGGLGIGYSPVFANGMLYVAGPDDNVYALNANTGALVWSHDTGAPTVALSAANGVIYGGSLWDLIYALDSRNGTLLWQYASGGVEDELISPPTIVNGVLYTATFEGSLRAFSPANADVAWNSGSVERPKVLSLHADPRLRVSSSPSRIAD